MAKYDKTDFSKHIKFATTTIMEIAFGIRSYMEILYNEGLTYQHNPQVTSEFLQISDHNHYRSNNYRGIQKSLPFLPDVGAVPGLRLNDDEVVAAVVQRSGMKRGKVKSDHGHWKQWYQEDVGLQDICYDKTALLTWCTGFLVDCGVTPKELQRFPLNDKLVNHRYFNSVVGKQHVTSGQYYHKDDLHKLAPSYILKIGQDFLAGKPLPFRKLADHANVNDVVKLTVAAAAAPKRAGTPEDVNAYVRSFMEAIRRYPVVCGLLAAGEAVDSPLVRFFSANQMNMSMWLNGMQSARYACNWIDRMVHESRKALLTEEELVAEATKQEEAEVEVEVEDEMDDGTEETADDEEGSESTASAGSVQLPYFLQLEMQVAAVRKVLEIQKKTGTPMHNCKELVVAFHTKLMQEDGDTASLISLTPPLEIRHWSGMKTEQHPLAELGCRALSIHGHQLSEKILRLLSNRTKAKASE